MFGIIDDCLPKDRCDLYKNKIETWYNLCVENGYPRISWEARILDISKDEICYEIKDLIEKRYNVSTKLNNAELQCWPENSYSISHQHDARGRQKTDYNSLIYLNDDFDGGEFFTETGITIKPTIGRLTFFNGSTVKHGLHKVLNNNRYTIIFWWKNTKFK